jgi:hypothetical protein
VLFGRPPDQKSMEVYNDFNSNLSNMFFCVKNRTWEFLRHLGFLPINSRDGFIVIRKFIDKEEFTTEYLKEELELAQYDEQIQKLQGAMLALIEENAKQGSYTEEFDGKYHEISEKIQDLKQKKMKLLHEKRIAESFQQRVEDMDACLNKTTYAVREFDEDLVRRLLQSVKVINGEKLEIRFKSGIVMQQRINYYE